MIKKSYQIILSIICLLLASAIYAGGPDMVPVASDPFNGFYVGGEGGLMHGRADIKTSSLFFENAVVGFLFPATASATVKKTAGIGGLFIGYGRTFSRRYYLGLEIQGFLGQLKQHFNEFRNYNLGPGNANYNINSQTTVKIEDGLGFYFRPGMLINAHTLLYALIGYALRDLTLRSNVVITETVQAGIPNSSFSLSRNAFTGGFAVGLGLESQILRHLFFRILYKFTDLNRTFNLRGGVIGAGVGLDYTYNQLVRLTNAHTSVILAALAWHFN